MPDEVTPSEMSDDTVGALGVPPTQQLADPQVDPEETKQPAEQIKVPKERLDKVIGKYVSADEARKKAEQERDEWKRKATSFIPPEDQKQPPKIEDFEDQTDYLVAKARFEAEQVYEHKFSDFQKQQEQKRLEQQDQKQAEIAQQRFDGFSSRLNQYAEKNPDLVQAVNANPELKFSPALSTIVTSLEGQDSAGNDIGSKVYHHLFQNPDLAKTLSELDPVSAGIEIGKISAGLKNGVAKNISNAPTPRTPITSGGGASTEVDFSKLEGDAFQEAYDKATLGR